MQDKITGKAGHDMWTAVIAIIGIMLNLGQTQGQLAQTDPEPQTQVSEPAGQTEPTYLGKPLSYWIASIRNRDQQIYVAFDAIMTLGPRAQAAVPDLTGLIAAPFVPVRIGVDDDDAVLRKLQDIDVRGTAVTALEAIGEDASSSSLPLIRWALTPRVVLERLESDGDRELYVDMVTMDVVERMRVAGVVHSFGTGAAPAIHSLLNAKDSESRKFGVAILSDAALPIVAHLLKSFNCDSRKLGVEMLLHMWPVVAKEHLVELKNMTGCLTSSH
jgi:hypothetical protein